jgi:hypothetical protein
MSEMVVVHDRGSKCPIFDEILMPDRIDFIQRVTQRRKIPVDAIYLGVVVAFFAMCFGMIRLFERL